MLDDLGNRQLVSSSEGHAIGARHRFDGVLASASRAIAIGKWAAMKAELRCSNPLHHLSD
jgi:hypothetical protein